MSVQDLHSRLHEEDLVIFDCRFFLSDVEKGRRLYATAHIPGAYALDLERHLSNPVSLHGGRHPLPNLDDLSQVLGEALVSPSSTVVVYDSGEGMATRAWWLLRYVGCQHVSVLDGGLTAWQALGYPCEADIPPRHDHTFQRTSGVGTVVCMEDVRQVVTGRAPGILLDARDATRYRGEIEPIDSVAGHIPSARSAPWQEGLSTDGRWKSDAEQRARFADILDQDEPIIVYCGSGVTACADIFALELAGAKDVRLYAGSYSDWISYPENEIESNPEVTK